MLFVEVLFLFARIRNNFNNFNIPLQRLKRSRVVNEVKFLASKTPFVGKHLFSYGPIFRKKLNLDNNLFPCNVSNSKNRKIIVIGLPKSGNNWLRFLLADCLDMKVVRAWDDIGKSGVTGTHERISPSLMFRNDLVFAVYILRDIRDIVVSYYHYSQTDYFKKEIDSECFFEDIESFYFEYFLSKVVPSYD